MKSLESLILAAGIMTILSVPHGFAEQKPEQTMREQCEKTEHWNLEVRIEHTSRADLPAWTGHIFALADGKAVESVSSTGRCNQLVAGNYVLTLHFAEKIPEIKEMQPFTFSINETAKTIFTLQIGHSAEPEMEHGVGRTGADFIKSDPRRGRDYINFELPKEQPERCLARCKDDPNCDAYSYADPPESKTARCWLIHGAAVPRPFQHSVSGVIQRDTSPYRVWTTTEPINKESKE